MRAREAELGLLRYALGEALGRWDAAAQNVIQARADARRDKGAAARLEHLVAVRDDTARSARTAMGLFLAGYHDLPQRSSVWDELVRQAPGLRADRIELDAWRSDRTMRRAS